ncbi:TonB-dependent receptor domain-containing protein [Xanthovirga aplysinae]|uniref:TonB-dependent receptor domain-containing protein n=1 Tax=Xanthovirga aplysinae TaxID=2529853 RepID=UPI001656F5A6|nr:TonB-dependent receptor [Xanthovirga aplysinae]
MKKLYISTLLFFIIGSAIAGSGKISGIVYEEINGKREPLPFVNIIAVGTQTGVTTDFDGNYSLNLDEGSYELEFSFIGYQAQKRSITINSGDNITLEVKLEADTKVLEDVVITGKADRQSETVLLLEQKKAAVITQNIGANELSRKGVSDVATGLTKVSGISMVGSRQLFVRGLGDRYNNAQLNGLPIASPDPDLRIIPLDIFPTQIVKNIGINKAFNSQMYADFSGGTFNIETKDYPEEAFLVASAGTSINTNTTFRPFKQMNDTQLKLPSEISSTDLFKPTSGSELPFSTDFSYNTKNAPINSNFSLSAGNTLTLFGQEIGFLVAGKLSNNFQYRNGTYKNLRSDGSPIVSYDFENFGEETKASGLANLYYEINPNHSIQFNSIYLRKTTDNLLENTGFTQDDRVFTRRSTYRIHQLLNSQLSGKHDELFGNAALNLSWGGSFAIAKSDEPDRRQLVYKKDQMDNGEEGFYFLNRDEAFNHRFFSKLREEELNGRVEVNYDLRKLENKFPLKATLGFQTRKKDRNFSARKFNYDLGPIGKDRVSFEELENTYLNANDFSDGIITKEDNAEVSIDLIEDRILYPYFAYLDVYATYGAIEIDVVPEKLNLSMALRSEYANQRIYYKEKSATRDDYFQKSQLKGTDFFPALNLKYSLNEKSNLRFSSSKTISRPEFKELAPFFYNPSFGSFETIGNPNLKNGYNYNFDLKYEIFPQDQELLAISIFGKYLKDPIERVLVATSVTQVSYANSEMAHVGGVEMELNKRLGSFIGEENALANLFISMNASLLYSKVKLSDTNNDDNAQGGSNTSVINTNKERALQGAAPYLFNFDLSYPLRIRNSETTISTTYNVFGKRVFTAGGNGAGDIFELPVNTLNLLLSTNFNEKIKVGLSFKNLLNPDIIQEQEILGKENVITNSYKKGREIGLSFSYNL